MTAETNTPADVTVEPVVEAVAEVEVAPKAEAKAERPTKRPRKAPRAKTKTKAARAQADGIERNDEMAKNTPEFFSGFAAFPGVVGFEKLFADAAQRGEEAVKRSRKTAEELADIGRANVDALVESGKIATSGAQSIGQQVLAKGRDNVEHAANTVRALAEAKTPADVLQLQSDYVRALFDRFVEETSSLTESLVKVAGEAFEPLTARASLNVERFNEFVA